MCSLVHWGPKALHRSCRLTSSSVTAHLFLAIHSGLTSSPLVISIYQLWLFFIPTFKQMKYLSSDNPVFSLALKKKLKHTWEFQNPLSSKRKRVRPRSCLGVWGEARARVSLADDLTQNCWQQKWRNFTWLRMRCSQSEPSVDKRTGWIYQKQLREFRKWQLAPASTIYYLCMCKRTESGWPWLLSLLLLVLIIKSSWFSFLKMVLI